MKKNNNEINEAREKSNYTLRPISKGIENILYKPLKVLDSSLIKMFSSSLLLFMFSTKNFHNLS